MRTVLSSTALQKLGKVFGEHSFESFPCPVPKHRGDARFVEEDGEVWIRCECGSNPRLRTLGEVWATIAYGEDKFLKGAQHMIWHRRLAHDLGELAPDPVDLPAHWRGSDNANKLAQGFKLLCGLRDNYPEKPVPYSVRFAAAWCGLSVKEAMYALRELKERGVIVERGCAGGTMLYAPGVSKDSQPASPSRVPLERERVAALTAHS